MQEDLRSKEKTDLLITRVTRLKVFVDKLGQRGRGCIETEAYLILEVFESRPRAILRYIRFALRRWRNSLWFSFQFGARLWWDRRIRRLDRSAAVDRACEAIEEKVFTTLKGGA